jgi:hypothetical protein
VASVPQNLTPNQRRFLACYGACCSVLKAARWAKINRFTHYTWLKESEAYREAFKEAVPIAAQVLEDEAVRRAHDGLRKAVWHKGKVVGYETEYSDSLMICLLKGNLPEKYRDKWTGELTGKDGKPLFDMEAVKAYAQSIPDEE